MELIKEKWTKSDGIEFQNYLKIRQNEKKQDFSRKIANTNFPVLGIMTPELKKIAKKICKGNFISFLDLNLTEYYENLLINGFLIANIKDFNEFKTRLYDYGKIVDSWACCDLLKFDIKEKDRNNFFNLSLEYIKDNHIFIRRIGVILWFGLLKFDDCFEKISKNIGTLKNENEYYVNMALSWFIAECFIKRRNETIKLFNSNVLNTFVTNKSIQKIRESFRASDSDKQMLLKYKK